MLTFSTRYPNKLKPNHSSGYEISITIRGEKYFPTKSLVICKKKKKNSTQNYIAKTTLVRA